MPKLAVFGGAFNPVHWGHVQVAKIALHQANLDRVVWVPSYHPPHKDQRELLPFEHRLAMVQLAIADSTQFVCSAIEQTLVEQKWVEQKWIEHQPRSPIYAVETLSALQMCYPQTQWYWVLGLDAFQTLPRWYGVDHLAQTCIWLVAPRPFCADAPAPAGVAAQFDGLSQGASDGLSESASEGAPDSQSDDQAVSQAVSQAASQAASQATCRTVCQTVAQRFALRSIQLQWQMLQMPPIRISSSLVRQACRQQQSLSQFVPPSVQTYLLTHHLYQSANR